MRFNIHLKVSVVLTSQEYYHRRFGKLQAKKCIIFKAYTHSWLCNLKFTSYSEYLDCKMSSYNVYHMISQHATNDVFMINFVFSDRTPRIHNG